MVDKQTLWETTDLRTVIERDLGKPKVRTSNYSQWPCPLHAEQKGCSFTVWANGWQCFGKCQRHGEVIGWLTEYHHMSREEAWIYLGLSEDEARKRFVTPARPAYTAPKFSIAEPPRPAWQAIALGIVEQGEYNLWHWKGERALDYLRGRGLIDEIIKEARLGFWPGRYDEWDFVKGLAIPCGVLIPRFAEGHLWGINVRRSYGDPKYINVGTIKRRESELGKHNTQNSLYWADALIPTWPVLVTEGEFDCLIAWQEAKNMVCPVTLGSADYCLNARWFAVLAGCNPILICTDNDKAGNKASEHWQSFGYRTRRITPPEGKDINKFYQDSGAGSVRDWLKTELRSSTAKAVAA